MIQTMLTDDEIKQIFAEDKCGLEDPHLFSRVFTTLVKKRKAHLTSQMTVLERVATEEYNEVSKRLYNAKIQDPCSVRNVLKTRVLATLLISDEGHLELDTISEAIKLFKQNLYSIGPDRESDAVRQEHILSVLEMLEKDKELQRLIKKVEKPYSHKFADQIIRDTLQLPRNISLTDTHAKRAVLSAWLCYLRQSVGSCFATAPCIIIHDELPKQFLEDIIELLNTGRLKRVFEGNEYDVPLSLSWGAGDLKRRFKLYRTLMQNEVKIWQSPGLIAAFQTAGLIELNLPPSDKRDRLKALLLSFIASRPHSEEMIETSAEEILRAVLLKERELTEEEINDFLSRPQEMIHSGLLMQVPSGNWGKKGIGQRCMKFLSDLEEAQNAFKGLADNALLKTWEFTVASFTEVKANFSKWNLYASLGMGAQEPGGIGQCLYQMLKQKLDEANRKIQKLQQEYEIIYQEVKILEMRYKRASSEKDAQWMRAEYQSKVNEFYTFEELRNKVHRRAECFANLFDVMIDMYLQLFPRYFQEVYNADLMEVKNQYDDSPAGFQLIYKHGRKNTAAWTRINSSQDFIQALTSFFVATEREIVTDPIMKGFEDDLGEIISKIIMHIKSEEFLVTAFHRMARAHHTVPLKDPLKNLDKIEKKPWVYTSGGSMETLISCYFRRDQKPTELTIWVENPTELLVFLIDSLKQLAPNVLEEFEKNPKKSLLMYSPTHAFLLKPGLNGFKNSWSTDAYTYIWARDEMLKERADFLQELSLDGEMIDFLLEKLVSKIPSDLHHFFRNAFKMHPQRLKPIEFREYVTKVIANEKSLRMVERFFLPSSEIDSMLYNTLPLIPIAGLQSKVQMVLNEIPSLKEVESLIIQSLDALIKESASAKFLSAKAFRDLCKSLICISLNNTSSSVDYHKLVDHAAQKCHLSISPVAIFADSNWMREMFAFVVNPGTSHMELWSVLATGTMGNPMSSWVKWLDGSQQGRRWGIYTHPHEYTS